MVRKHHVRPVLVVPVVFLVLQFVLFSFLAHISAQTTTYVPGTYYDPGTAPCYPDCGSLNTGTYSTAAVPSGPLYVSDPVANSYLKGIAKFTLTGSDNVGQVRLNFVRTNWGSTTTPRVEWPSRYDANHWALNIDTKTFSDGTYSVYATGMVFSPDYTTSTYYQSPPVTMTIANYSTTGSYYPSTTSGNTSGTATYYPTTSTTSGSTTTPQTGTETTSGQTTTGSTGTATTTAPKTATGTTSTSPAATSGTTATTSTSVTSTTKNTAPTTSTATQPATGSSLAQTTAGQSAAAQNQTIEPAKLPDKFARNLDELKSTKVIEEQKKDDIKIETITNTTINVPKTPENTDKTISEDQIPTVDKDQTKAQTAIVISGKAVPNTTVYVYIFSDPIIIAVNTDAQGNWVYVLDKPLDQGKHEAYVVLQDSETQEVVRTEPTAFFVSTAEARSNLLSPGNEKSLVLEDPFKVMIRTYATYASVVIAIAVAIIIELYIRKRHRQKELMIEKAS